MIGRATSKLLAAPRFGPEEDGLKADLDALGGEVVRLRSRDGLKLTGRWLPADAGPIAGDEAATWRPDPYEAILVLHGWTGSVAPDLVALAPSLRRTAGWLHATGRCAFASARMQRTNDDRKGREAIAETAG